VAAIDAKRRLGSSLDSLRILSLGTGKSNQFYSIKRFKRRELFGWGIATRWGRSKLVQMFLNLQSESANNMLGLLLERDQILRLDFESDKDLPMDKPGEFDDLVTRADREFTHSSVRIKEFLQRGGRNE
jgi:hypothetical protein